MKKISREDEKLFIKNLEKVNNSLLESRKIEDIKAFHIRAQFDVNFEKYLFSENFLKKMLPFLKKDVHWPIISLYQKLSSKFIKEHINFLVVHNLLLNKNINEKLKKEIALLKEII